ncbi:bifunctional lysylphosphatidylglycerol flippase/synthetase MprF [Ensifer adhaerens]|uniref:bifunctional lysylphosphatidylglycerol flippase/synthetase MprF n=2 Tax=Ensifer TaxID=106591 RepID=UPI001CBFB00B|nr:bifunctional lysylphosphatidylglycerol flippase/synthetase MprF [Ensifer adhaerens]MBZ7921066.1 bifunctional lysylphosphatidylglycerol flippase/synthetase MprF [Ensifer adhaerens]UAX93511.1 bifunctional lysylphosphatidylglycerol flippase/synthetase MprF [Ensifer adhaerens]UAY01148.1 bifunctional lysylphosphatidylglycerol flippase/synthetase MprF [Ensifer adhaerens]UAY08529.1 bifunctional lysylphosphatidylglycerol flippase/synthetase MprF [Ensifer adhaerens]
MTSSISESATDDEQQAEGGWISFLRRNRRYLSAAGTLFVIALFGFAIFHLTSEVQYDEVVQALADTPWTAVAAAIFFTALSFLALTFYDVSALDYVRRKLPYADVALTAACAYAVGNTAGFGALSGGAIRYRSYSRLGIEPENIARIIAFVTLAFGLGLLTVTCLSLLAVGEYVAPMTGLDPLFLRLIAVIILGGLFSVFFLARDGREVSLGRLTLRLPDSRTVSRQFLVTALDLAASATVLYVLLPAGTIGWPAFLAVYSLAVGVGVLSHVPAGLGVFETIIIATLGHNTDVDTILGALVLYRVIYHVLPLVIAIAVVIGIELRQLAGHPVASSVRRIGGRMTPLLLATLGIVLAIMLVLSSVTPTPDENLAFLESLLPLPIVEGAHFLASLLGLALVVVSRGLALRLDGAWWASIVIAIAALLLSLIKAIAVVEAGMLAFFLLGLLVSRRLFVRPASLFGQALTIPWLTALGVICLGGLVVLLFVYRDVEYSHELWWQFEFSAEAPRGLRALLGVTIGASMLAIWSLMRPAAGSAEPASNDAMERALAIVEAQNMSDANLVRMGDKSILFSADRRAFIMYGQRARSWIALFDPVGPIDAWPELIWHFIEKARAAGCRAVFYQVSPEGLAYYADAGLRAFRLGELARVDLARFEMKGGKWANLRQQVSRAQRDGLEFRVVSPADVPGIMADLTEVSDAWLAHHNAKEKGFSLGAFDPDYLTEQPVAILTSGGRIVAFANILVTATKEEGTVDLMRFSPDAPKGAMDFLFAQVMEYLKAEGFRAFNLGMAPLSGMSTRQIAPVWDRAGRTFFEHGERFYNFKGLRAFKSKFHPQWQPRYLVASGGINPILALMDATFLIGGGLKGVVKK